MDAHCPYCISEPKCPTERRTVARKGFFRRTSDHATIQRFRCFECKRTFSTATFDPCYRQLKRQCSDLIRVDLSSAVSQRRVALKFKISRTTVVRKFLFLTVECSKALEVYHQAKPKAREVEIDDLETHEHSRGKPISVMVMVEAKTRRILGFDVSQMPARGRAAMRSREKYGKRQDLRSQGRAALFERTKSLCIESVRIKSDQHSHYAKDVRKFFPLGEHLRYKGRRPVDHGQGELKQGRDPLFSINHTLGMCRANINRLIRETWCTTKKAERLFAHLTIFAHYHNTYLLLHPTTPSRRPK